MFKPEEMPTAADITPEKAQEIILCALLEEVASLKARVEKLEQPRR